MTLYRTTDGDMIDEVCKAHYGSTAPVVAVYEANPGLAAQGPILPKGIVVELPELDPAPTVPRLRLYG